MASLHFYRYYLEENDCRTSYNLVNLIDYMWNELSSEERTVKIGDHWDSMSKCHVPNDNSYIRFFWIDKKINVNPTEGKLGTDDREPVEGSLYNSASCLLIPFYNLLIIFQPQGSPSSSEISKYLSNYVRSRFGKHRFHLDILPIVNDLTFSRIDESYDVKNAYFTVDVGDIHRSLRGNRLIDGIVDLSKYADSYNSKSQKKHYILKVGIKNSIRGNYIGFALVKSLINSIFYSNSILEAGLSVKGPKDHRFKDIRITKDSNVLVPFNLNQKSPGWEFIYDQMYHEYYENTSLPEEVKKWTQSDKSLKKISPDEVHFINDPKNDFKNVYDKYEKD